MQNDIERCAAKKSDLMNSAEIKRIESQAWGDADLDIARIATKSSHVIGALLLKRSIQDFELVGTTIINVGGGHGEEAEFLLKNGAETVTIIDIALKQLKNARFRKEEHCLGSLECARGDAENLPFKDDSFDLGFIYLALHHFPNHSKSISEVCRVSREVIFIDIMNPILTRILTRFGFWRAEACGVAPNRLNGKDVENMLINQKLKPKVTYFFVPPSNTYDPFLTRCLISVFKLTNQIVTRSRSVGLLCGNVAIISGTSTNKDQNLDALC